MNHALVSPLPALWRRAVRRVVIGLLGATGLLAAGAALADPPGRVGRIAETEGTVWLADDQRGDWTQAVRNAPLTGNDRMSLAPGARAVVHIGSATVRLDGDTELEVLQLDDRAVRLHLHGGSAALQLPMDDVSREFEIVTAEGRFMPSLRGHYRVDRRPGTSVVTVWDGSLRFDSADSQLDVRQGQRVDFWFENGRTHFASQAMDRDAFTDWVVASEQRYGRQAQRYVSPEMTGAYDLEQYGSWETHPQYGPVWYPRTVVADWAPYRYGHWSWVAPWGWTWVDDAPWGFAPFHYGRWVHHRGRWCWTPGGYAARPVYSPALVAWFGGPNVTVGVNLGHAPHVGWVALGPFDVFAPWYAASHSHLSHINVNPWRHMQGYHHHRHDDYMNGHVRGAVVVVPQTAVVDRRSINQTVVTPTQAQIWRGGRPPALGSNAVAIRVPVPQVGGTAATPMAVIVPPAPIKSTAVAPPPKSPNGREVAWVRGGGTSGTNEGGVPVAAPAVVAPALPGRDPRAAAPASARLPPPTIKTQRGEDSRPAPHVDEGRQVVIPTPPPQHRQPQDARQQGDDEGRVQARGPGRYDERVHRVPTPSVQHAQPTPQAHAPQVQAPVQQAPMPIPQPAQQVHVQRPPQPMQPAPQVQPVPHVQPMPQVQSAPAVPAMPQMQQHQPRGRPSQDRDDERQQRRPGPKDDRGAILIK